LVLHGGAAARAAALGITHWHLSLTHTAGQALRTLSRKRREPVSP
jgi:hypothetical protein